jgi:hypothetical protein
MVARIVLCTVTGHGLDDRVRVPVGLRIFSKSFKLAMRIEVH